MKLKQFLQLIKPNMPLYIYDIDNENNLLNRNKYYLTELEYDFPYLYKDVTSVEPWCKNEEFGLKITISIEDFNIDDEFTKNDLETIEDLFMENIENNEEQLHDIEDEFRSFYYRRNKKFKSIVEKIEYILDEFYE